MTRTVESLYECRRRLF